jgi:hypothetical protein
MKGKRKSPFERDFGEVANRFPKLTYGWVQTAKIWMITGELDICDTEGVYWDTFMIAIFVPRAYPYCVPIVMEKSNLIPRDIAWHISPEGFCCLDVGHNLTALSKKGINMADFIASKIYTYFANQLYKLAEKHYAGDEYAHHVDGILQYYIEELRLPGAAGTLSVLNSVINNSGISRNDTCPCGSGLKVKNCHQREIETIKTLGYDRVKTDWKDIAAIKNAIT